MKKSKRFPSIITGLPEADIPVDGLRSYLFQGESRQVLFMEFDKDADVPEHKHAAQWGLVIDGEIELTVGGTTRIFRKGDEYFIPEGESHSAKIRAGYRDITLFDQKDRYRVKE